MKRKTLLLVCLASINAVALYTLAQPLQAQPPEITCPNTDCDGASKCEYKESNKCSLIRDTSGEPGCGVTGC